MTVSGQLRRIENEPVRSSDLEATIVRSRNYLLSIQFEDGHWCGELEGDTILESEYILTMHFLGRTEDARVRKAAEFIRRKQLDEGGWPIYPGGPAEVSASVKAYFVLKLLGDRADQPHMRRAREAILRLGGMDACNSFTRLYLAIFGQYPWERCPAVPPEIILLPSWFYINIYEMSSWSRAIVIPLSIIWALKPSRPLPAHARIPELFSPTYKPGPAGFWAARAGASDPALPEFWRRCEAFVERRSRRYAAEAADLEGLGRAGRRHA